MLIYLILVCKHTWICDDFLPLFVYDGKASDTSGACSREDKRKNEEKKKDKMRHEVAVVAIRGMTIDEEHFSISLRVQISKQERDRRRDKVADLHIQKNSLLTQNGQYLSMLGNMYSGEPKEMKKDGIWEKV